LVGFYAGCAAIGAAVWIIAWPIYFPAPAKATPEPPKIVEAPIVPTRRTEATPERAIYKCKKADTNDQKAIDASNSAFKKYIEVYADAFDLRQRFL
jgi:hypothetical protein